MSVDITVNDLIISAFSTIGIYSPYKVLGGDDTLTGLYHLNELLDYFQSSGIYIPFFSEIFFNMTVGKGEYIISNNVSADITHNPIIELSYVNIFYNDVSYPVSIVSYDQLDDNVRNTQINARPNQVILQKGIDTSKVIFWPLPDLVYDCRLRGKAYFSDVQLQDHMSEVPGYYHIFLRYALARQLIGIYKSNNWSADQEKEYQQMLSKIETSADFSLSIDKNPTFGTQTVITDSRIGVVS